MGLEDREDLLLMRDGLTLENSPPDLVDLALGIVHVVVQLPHPGRWHTAVYLQGHSGSARTLQEDFRLSQIVPVYLTDRLLLRNRSVPPFEKGGLGGIFLADYA